MNACRTVQSSNGATGRVTRPIVSSPRREGSPPPAASATVTVEVLCAGTWIGMNQSPCPGSVAAVIAR